MTELAYHYLARSTVSDEGELTLATSGGSTAAGPASNPYFFSGFVEHPTPVAAALLVLARVARTRFYVPPGTLAAILRAADPVVTCTPDGLRFESFSVCCGLYARLDVDRAGLDAQHSVPGVTNVDFNPPMRQALAGLVAREPLHLSIGADGLRARTMDADVVEERVALPERWLKGFAETQAAAPSLVEQFELDRVGLTRFLQSVPRNSPTKTVLWATPAARGARLAARPGPGAVVLGGPERLRVLEPLVRFASRLRAFGLATTAPTASAWVMEIPGGRVTIMLSPEKSRGFSGEGGVLDALRRDEVAADADLVSALLAFEPSIDVARLAAGAALPAQRVTGALALLASSGQVGYDLARQAFFHRPLPMRTDALEALHPRLVKARALAAAGAVTGGAGHFTVASGGAQHQVRLTGDSASCSCPWYARYRDHRGPCAHILAVRIDQEDPT